jgi:hypothetical protein
MTDDHIYTYVPIGDHYVERGSLNRYVLHCLKEHEDDIMGWDMLRACLHDQVKYSRIDLFLCPVCHVTTKWYPRWHCETCNRILTLKDVATALNKYTNENKIRRSL